MTRAERDALFDQMRDAEVIPNPTLPVSPDHRWRVEECDRDRVLFVGRFDRVKGLELGSRFYRLKK